MKELSKEESLKIILRAIKHCQEIKAMYNIKSKDLMRSK